MTLLNARPWPEILTPAMSRFKAPQELCCLPTKEREHGAYQAVKVPRTQQSDDAFEANVDGKLGGTAVGVPLANISHTLRGGLLNLLGKGGRQQLDDEGTHSLLEEVAEFLLLKQKSDSDFFFQ